METQKQVRCAIYTRKSTDEGLEKEFNTLEAQREAGENYVKSLKHQGWVTIPEHYDDGGFSGGSLKRPALKRLIEDVEAGKIDMIVVYKIKVSNFGSFIVYEVLRSWFMSNGKRRSSPLFWSLRSRCPKSSTLTAKVKNGRQKSRH